MEEKVKLQVELEGTTYDVEVEVVDTIPPATHSVTNPVWNTLPPAPRAPEPRKKRRLHVSREENECRTPMCGVIVSVNVRPGQFVEEDDVVLILEAMKMETAIRAPRSGHVKAIHVRAGDRVATDAMLVEITPLLAAAETVE